MPRGLHLRFAATQTRNTSEKAADALRGWGPGDLVRTCWDWTKRFCHFIKENQGETFGFIPWVSFIIPSYSQESHCHLSMSWRDSCLKSCLILTLMHAISFYFTNFWLDFPFCSVSSTGLRMMRIRVKKLLDMVSCWWRLRGIKCRQQRWSKLVKYRNSGSKFLNWRNKLLTISKNETTQTPRQCFNCRGVGHLQRDCPSLCRPQAGEYRF